MDFKRAGSESQHSCGLIVIEPERAGVEQLETAEVVRRTRHGETRALAREGLSLWKTVCSSKIMRKIEISIQASIF